MKPMNWAGALNAWQVRDGLWRLAKTDHLEPEGWAQLPATVVDVRTPEEIPVEDYTPNMPHGRRWYNRPLEDRANTEFWARYDPYPMRPAHAVDILATFPERVREALNTVWKEWNDGGVVVNCSAGRDRTGLVIAMLLNRDDAPGGRASWVEQSRVYSEAVRGINDARLIHPHPVESYMEPDELEEDIAQRLGELKELLADWPPERIKEFMDE